MRIGQIAKKAEVNIQTIRFYEREGIIKLPLRLASGYRDYSEQTVEVIRLVKQMQNLGFTLKEIKDLFAKAKHQNPKGVDFDEYLQKKTAEIEQKIESLQKMKQNLRQLRAAFDVCVCLDGTTPCPEIAEFTKKL